MTNGFWNNLSSKSPSTNAIIEICVLTGCFLFWIGLMLIKHFLTGFLWTADESGGFARVEIRDPSLVPKSSSILFVLGDIIAVPPALYGIYKSKRQSMKLYWVCLFLGVSLGMHQPAIIRAWLHFSIRYRDYELGEYDDKANNMSSWDPIVPVMVIAICSCISFVLTMVGVGSCELFPNVSAKVNIVCKLLLVLGVICGHMSIPVGIFRDCDCTNVGAGYVLLITSFSLAAMGYISGRIIGLTNVAESSSNAEEYDPLVELKQPDNI